MKVYDLEVGWLALADPTAPLSFGGTRITEGVTRDEVVGLADAMHRKLAVHSVPVAGAKAGVRTSADEAPEALAAFADEVRELLATRVVLGKDMGATNTLIDGLYASIGLPQLAPVQVRHPGCPDKLRDLAGYRHRMTALGVRWSAEEAYGELAGARVAVQGWGVVGAGSAWRLARAGARVVAASDLDGMCTEVDVDGALGPRVAPPEALFSVDCDLFVLAAASHTVGADAAEQIRARVVVEGSNFGLRPEAREVLSRRGIRVVPDVIASSSSAAMVCWQLATGNGLAEAELWARIEAAIRRAASGGV